MSRWQERRSEILAGLQELQGRETFPTASRGELLHQTLIRCHDLENARKDLPPNLKCIASNSLAIEDFRTLSTLSSSGPFNRVELVSPSTNLTGSSASASKVLVVKTVDRRWAFRMRQQQSIVHEIAVLRLGLANLSTSPRIPQLVASFLSPSSCHLILSHAPGGDLWSLLESSIEGKDPAKNEGLPEESVRYWIAELVDAVEWLHEKGWAHRDIKPHNLLLLASGHLQLTDFGSVAPLSSPSYESRSTTVSRPSSVSRKHAVALVGTPDYIAPEILRHAERVAQEEEDEEDSNDFDCSRKEKEGDERAYGKEVDWWSVGIVLYELLFGQAPFFAEAIAETYERIIEFRNYLRIPKTSSVSEDARDLIALLLVESDERPTAREIKRHRWFQQVDWSNLRTATPPYIPPPFVPPQISPSTSFTHHPESNSSFTTFSNSFFSSPGLSILRPSPSTVEGARKEEKKYWEASEFGGLTTLPSTEAFLPDPLASFPANPSSSSPIVPTPSLPFKDTSRFTCETPARPPSFRNRFDPPHTSSSTPGSSATRSRRKHLTDVEAWREMQEHAWEVGTSARKKHEPREIEPSSLGSAKKLDFNRAVPSEENRGIEDVPREGEGRERDLGLLEARHEEMVKDLEEMGKKYDELFALASREGAVT